MFFFFFMFLYLVLFFSEWIIFFWLEGNFVIFFVIFLMRLIFVFWILFLIWIFFFVFLDLVFSVSVSVFLGILGGFGFFMNFFIGGLILVRDWVLDLVIFFGRLVGWEISGFVVLGLISKLLGIFIVFIFFLLWFDWIFVKLIYN